MTNQIKEVNGAISISLLTGADDPAYALPLTKALTMNGVNVDFIGNDDMADADVFLSDKVNYFNLRGSQNEKASFGNKVSRILKYYLKLIRYAYITNNTIFHILWLNKFIYFDRTLLNYFYKFIGKKIIYTAHNINQNRRDGADNLINKLTLRLMYSTVDHIFVHTKKGKNELIKDFHVDKDKITIIPFGMNDTAPLTDLLSSDAKKLLGLKPQQKTILFFGQIAPYKGLIYLANSLPLVCKSNSDVALLIAGRVKKGNLAYWESVEHVLKEHDAGQHVIKKIEFIPDSEIEIYFKAADVLILPYTDIFQSGVVVLSYYFGLPVIATDVGEFSEDIIEGKTGFLCRPKDPIDLADKIRHYFDSPIYHNLAINRKGIRDYANRKYSWEIVGERTLKVYQSMAGTFKTL